MNPNYLILTFFTALALGAYQEPGFAQNRADSVTDEVRVNGLVLDCRKYSFTLQAVDQTYQVEIPNGTPMLMKLNRPSFDFDKGLVSTSLMLSAQDGNPDNDQVLSWKLPDPTIVTMEFRSQEEKKAIEDESVPNLDRFVLTAQPFADPEQSISGELQRNRISGELFLNDQGKVMGVRLGARRGLLAGFSIMDLIPNQTSVWVQGARNGDAIVASRIRFEYLGDPITKFDPALPNLLSLGDLTSVEYQRPLMEALKGKANVHHPPNWAGPSRNWNRLHHYVGKLDQAEPTWDVITFNYGIHDDKVSREDYQENLRYAIRQLQRTGAKLVWVNSAPIPNGYPAGDPNQPLRGRVRGRMNLQNQWATTVLKEFPEVGVCDLWQLIKDQENERYADWWKGDSVSFNYLESVPLGRKVAESAMRAIGRNGDINPPSVHQPTRPLSGSR